MAINETAQYIIVRAAILEELRRQPHYAAVSDVGVSLSDVATDAATAALKAIEQYERNR